MFAFQVAFDKDMRVDINGEPPRANFNSVWEGFTTIFIVFIGEDWQLIMQDHFRASGWFSIVFFIPLYIIGNLILLNLFLAILLQNVETTNDGDEGKDSDANALTNIRHRIRVKWDMLQKTLQ